MASMAASVSADEEISTIALEGAEHRQCYLNGKDERIIFLSLVAVHCMLKRVPA